MSLSRAKNIFMPANINSIVILLDILAEENGGGLMATSYKHQKVSRVFRDLKNIKFCAKNNIYRLYCEEWEVANNAEYK